SHTVSRHDVYFRKRIIAITHVKIMKWYDYEYLEKIEVRREDQTLHMFKEGIIYLDKLKRNRLMRSDELYKFSDGTLTSIRTVLQDIAFDLRMEYLPKRKWSERDRTTSRIMIKAIDKHLYERRLMRNLEKSVGGREYGEDFRLLERII
nr:hypothetical protein [Tanacetum cinerariifolium]